MADSSHSFATDGDADDFITAHEVENGFRYVIRKTKLCGLTSKLLKLLSLCTAKIMHRFILRDSPSEFLNLQT